MNHSKYILLVGAVIGGLIGLLVTVILEGIIRKDVVFVLNLIAIGMSVGFIGGWIGRAVSVDFAGAFGGALGGGIVGIIGDGIYLNPGLDAYGGILDIINYGIDGGDVFIGMIGGAIVGFFIKDAIAGGIVGIIAGIIESLVIINWWFKLYNDPFGFYYKDDATIFFYLPIFIIPLFVITGFFVAESLDFLILSTWSKFKTSNKNMKIIGLIVLCVVLISLIVKSLNNRKLVF